MNHGTLLSKSGVAVRKASTPTKRTAGIPKPPTPADLRKKVAIAETKKRNLGKSVKWAESESDSQPLATRRIGGKLPLASLPEIQVEPTEESTERMNSRSDARNGASERMMIENPEVEQNEGTSTSATGRASKTTETEKRNDNEGDIPEEAPKAMPAAGGKKKQTAKQRLVSTRAKTRKVTRHLENQAGKERR